MRGIGWLNIIRPGIGVDELLNDLRFLKNADSEGIVVRNMADSDLCELYNYQWNDCAVGGLEESQNSIYTLGTDGSEGLTLVLSGSVPIAYDATAGDVQAALETVFGAGNVVASGGPLGVDLVTIEFIGDLAGTDVTLTLDGFAEGAALDLIQVGGTAQGSFDAINWESPQPWVGEESLTSPDFLGIWVENWEGLEGEFDRTTNARGWSFGGSNFTPLRPRHLSMTFEVILGATTERGLQYGFRWLSNMLYGLDSCDRSELVVFDNCPPAGTSQADWPYWLIRDGGVLDMPRWGDILLDTKNCVLRRVTFVLGARDPHKYKCPVICTELTEFIVPEPATDCAPAYSWSEWFCNDNIEPICCEYDAPPFDFTSRAVIVHIASGTGGAPPMSITVTTGSGEGSTTSEFRTLPIPPGAELIIDSSRHEIRYIDAGVNIDGSGYISAAFGTSPTWAEIGPLGTTGEICVRPLRICGLAGAGAYIETVDRV